MLYTYTANKNFLGTQHHEILQGELQLLVTVCQTRSSGILEWLRWIQRIGRRIVIRQGKLQGKIPDRKWKWWRCPSLEEVCWEEAQMTKVDRTGNLGEKKPSLNVFCFKQKHKILYIIRVALLGQWKTMS